MTKKFLCITAFLLSALSLSGYAAEQTPSVQTMSQATIKTTSHPKFGKILTDDKGMTLYLFTPDKNSTSTCYDQCAITWPPLLIASENVPAVPGVTGKLGTTKRRDGTFQVTYNGMPLYYYVNDKRPGDANGQNVENKWYVIKLNGQK